MPARRVLTAAGALSLALTACGKDELINPGDRTRVELSVAVDRPAAGATRTDNQPAAAPSAAGIVIASGRDTIVVTRAQLVLREIELEFAGAQVCSAIAREDGSDTCGELSRGPVLFDVPVSGATASRLSVPVPTGRYEELEVSIHAVRGGDDAERTFLQANPELRGVSARVEGRYNGAPFTFLTDVGSKIELEFAPPLEVGAQGANITLAVDIARWFARGGATGGLFNPAQANTPGSVRSTVEGNIRASFKALRDRNKDGRED
jgi:hypothetical protein